MTDLLSELNPLAGILGTIPPIIADLRSGDKVQIAEGIFVLIGDGEQIAVAFDPALAAIVPATKIFAFIVELILKYGKVPDISDPSMTRFDGPENPSD